MSMSKRTVRDKTSEHPLAPPPIGPEDAAPSIVRPDEPTLARIIGFIGLLLITIGSAALLAGAFKWRSNVSPAWGVVFFVTGLCGLLYHAAVDTDIQWRRTYGTIGFCWILAGMICSVVPVESEMGSLFMPHGMVCFALGLFFLLPFARNEDDPMWHFAIERVLGAIGVTLALIGLVVGHINDALLFTRGLPLALLGMCYLWAYVGQVGTSSQRGYWAGLAIGGAGLLTFLVALGRAIVPPLLYSWGWIDERPGAFLVPQGLVLMAVGVLYLGMSCGMCSESQLVVLTRKELGSYFFSPIAYIVLLGLTAIAWWRYNEFLSFIVDFSQRPAEVSQDPLVEPIVLIYVLNFYVLLAVIFSVVAITMRTFSEERRSGTLEVMFTAPVHESTLVLSKFIAGLLFFLLTWLPWVLFLVDLRVEGGRPLDYRPMLSFLLALACTGASFISMGIFFSSLTRNQIAAAVLTFVGMMVLTGVIWIKGNLPDPEGALSKVLTYVSYIDLWVSSLNGLVAPKHLIFHLSVAVFWLFLTVKVLESRKWR
jgi:ABC-type transport system involved in multi-copper enzyme maturation permease subunit